MKGRRRKEEMDKCPYCKRQLAGEICPAHGYIGKEKAVRTAADVGAAPALYGVPSGGIIMWSGAASAIPAGWVVCDGTNGTPDLVGRFIIGTKTDSGATYDVADTGGATEVTLTGPESGVAAHAHTHPAVTNVTVTNIGGEYMNIANWSAGNTGTAGPTNAAEAHENMPPYYALCYIQKT